MGEHGYQIKTSNFMQILQRSRARARIFLNIFFIYTFRGPRSRVNAWVMGLFRTNGWGI